MSTVTLNLSRKWRSQDFDQLIGQDLAVRVLKNSLYRGQFFPVYLFAGQRGCGKTSTARIFAAAINCAALSSFQKDPKSASVPCLVCDSCNAMRDGKHPDFVEIDAASHTGVDNIRSIIESSTLLPLMGHKRVYLIDEAHMLSKAAFNAALKILEEPPATALFILATTNQQKIIDTVRSRCFQLFFRPILHAPLKAHLQVICQKEKLVYSDEALDLIVRQSEGSARDALNMLEQVRFSNSAINKESVLAFLGHIGDQYIFDLITFTIQGNEVALVKLFHSLDIDNHKAEFIWQRMVVLLRALIWFKYGVNSQDSITAPTMLEQCAMICSLADLHRVVEALYVNEELFFKTVTQHIFLEMILLGLCYKDKKKTDNNGNEGVASSPMPVVLNDSATHENEVSSDDINYENQWMKIVEHPDVLKDSLLYSLFKQARFISYDIQSQKVCIELSKDFILFKESLHSSQAVWLPLLKNFFAMHAILDLQFTGTQRIERDKIIVSHSNHKEKLPEPVRPQEPSYNAHRYVNSKKVVAEKMHKGELPIDVSDENVWKKASMLLRHFPGVITEIRENR